jgi:hypothetical protein
MRFIIKHSEEKGMAVVMAFHPITLSPFLRFRSSGWWVPLVNFGQNSFLKETDRRADRMGDDRWEFRVQISLSQDS